MDLTLREEYWIIFWRIALPIINYTGSGRKRSWPNQGNVLICDWRNTHSIKNLKTYVFFFEQEVQCTFLQNVGIHLQDCTVTKIRSHSDKNWNWKIETDVSSMFSEQGDTVHVPPKCKYSYTRLHGVMTQMTTNWPLTPLKTPKDIWGQYFLNRR
jgi:hypothetical protein